MCVIIVQFACLHHSILELHIAMVVAVNLARACFHPNKKCHNSILCCVVLSVLHAMVNSVCVCGFVIRLLLSSLYFMCPVSIALGVF